MVKKFYKKHKSAVIFFLVLIVALFFIFFVKNNDFPLLKPSGDVARRQKDLLLFTALLSLFVIIPVFYMLFKFTKDYDEKNINKDYKPELDNNTKIEVLWWIIPIILITILGVVTFRTSHSLDPFKPLKSDKKPLVVDVVALQWKWLFIYPEEKIVSVNYVKMPVDRPVNFHITSDAPMNSFWIPALGSQIYAMAGMESQVNLMANKAGDFPGVSANLSGEGFADMKFTASAVDENSYQDWVVKAQNSPNGFNQSDYDQLVKPSKANPVAFYHLGDPDIFSNIVNKYMGHEGMNSTNYKKDENSSSMQMDHNMKMEGMN
jgi:cytochrome o ubiquinol oxidase subunit 2